MRNQVWFGILVCTLAVIPGWLAGTVMAVIYRYMAMMWIGPEPDVFFLKTLFGIETPAAFLRWFLFNGAPAIVQGIITGMVAVFLTDRMYKGLQLETAAYTAAALWTGAMGMLFIVAMNIAGWQNNYLESFANVIGLWSGIVGGFKSAHESQQDSAGVQAMLDGLRSSPAMAASSQQQKPTAASARAVR